MAVRSLPLGPIRLSVRVRRNPGFRWLRFSVRRLMVVVLLAALVCFVVERQRRAEARVSVTITYPVGNLVGRVDLDPRFTTLNGVSQAVIADVPEDRWSGTSRSVTPFFLSNSLIVRDNRGGHRLVVQYLSRFRVSPKK